MKQVIVNRRCSTVLKKGRAAIAGAGHVKTVEKPKIPSDAEILRKIQNETLVVDGQEMTKRELGMRLLQKEALSGNMTAFKLLDALSTKAGVSGGKPHRKGVLLLPPKVTVEEWEKVAGENQAPYRENRRDDGAGD